MGSVTVYESKIFNKKIRQLCGTPPNWVNCNAIATSCMSHKSVKWSKRWVC